MESARLLAFKASARLVGITVDASKSFIQFTNSKELLDEIVLVKSSEGQ